MSEHSAAYQAGYDACQNDIGQDTFNQNPYRRGSIEWNDFREGWAVANHHIWQAVLMNKRKASTE